MGRNGIGGRSSFEGMYPDAKRWRFLADNNLVLNRSSTGVSIMFYEAPESPQLAPKFLSVATGLTPDEAIDNAIARWEKKHKRKI